MNINLWLILLVIFSILFTVITFVNTIITKKWRNKVENENECWKLGVIYFNPNDERIFLPKRTGLGFTFNFAKPVAQVFFVLIILAIIYSIIIGS